MFSKLVIAALLLAIVISLFTGLFFLIKDDNSRSKRTVRALTLRVGLQVALIAFLFLASTLGWIHPHGIGR